MRTIRIDALRSPAPGDIRMLGAGDRVELGRTARDRQDWMGVLNALLVAIHRGADVVWSDTG